MKISDYIQALESLKNEHGDLEVEKLDVRFDRVAAKVPTMAYRMVLTKRESKPAFWSNSYSVERQGEKVIKV